MTKTLDNFTKKISKLENYYILNEETDFYIMGTHKTITEYRAITGNIFQHFSENIEKSFPLFFILAFDHKFSKFKEFKAKGIPMLIMPKEFKVVKLEILLEEFDNFINTRF